MTIINDTLLDDLLDHARSSEWRGALSGATHRGRARNATCGDEVSFELQIVDGQIQQMKFQGKGCFLSQATASLLCERLTGQELDKTLILTPQQMLGFDLHAVSTLRQRCCLLAIDAFRQCSRWQVPST